MTVRSEGDQASTPEEPRDIYENLNLQVQNFYYRVVKGYIPRPYSGKVTLFRVDKVPVELLDDPTLGWREVAEEVDVHLVPGEHLTCITTHIQVLGEKLRTSLDKAQADD